MRPFQIVFYRVSLAAIAMLAFLHFTGERLPTDLRSWFGLAIMGLLNNAIPFSAIVFGQQYISGGLAAILNSTTAFFGVILSGLLLRDEAITLPKLIGVIIGILGVSIVLGVENLAGMSAGLSLSTIGQGLIIIAAISYACAAIWGKIRIRGMGVHVTATGMLITSSFWMLILATFIEGFPIEALSLRSAVASVTLAVVCTSIAYTLYFHILSMAGASNLTLVTIIVPPFALLLDALALGTLISGQELLGFGVIALGLLVVAGKIKLPLRNKP
jgi:drug/metabolite transporter (DMT)-like permease